MRCMQNKFPSLPQRSVRCFTTQPPACSWNCEMVFDIVCILCIYIQDFFCVRFCCVASKSNNDNFFWSLPTHSFSNKASICGDKRVSPLNKLLLCKPFVQCSPTLFKRACFKPKSHNNVPSPHPFGLLLWGHFKCSWAHQTSFITFVY